MIIVMKAGASQAELEAAIARVEELGYQPHVIRGTVRNVIACIGDERGKARLQSLDVLEGVENVVPILQPFKLASRETRAAKSIVRVGDVEIGGDRLVVMAGPCSVESESQILETAFAVKEAGAAILRGGAFKPRTSPYDFQGLEEEGLKLLARAREATGLPVITEVMKPEDVDLVSDYADILQIGARNVQNFPLLRRAGESPRAVMLKRGMATTIKEWLMCAEYILSSGNQNVLLCERGIRTFETATRFTLDLNAVPVVQKLSHLPIVVDPAHGTGHWEYVIPMAKAGIAAGADAIMVEVHPQPDKAASDGAQSLKPKVFAELMREIKPFAHAAGKWL
jgi:3-deoxy-7-phosphoheptulonate synthase